jgi:hypothetical protein
VGARSIRVAPPRRFRAPRFNDARGFHTLMALCTRKRQNIHPSGRVMAWRAKRAIMQVGR